MTAPSPAELRLDSLAAYARATAAVEELEDVIADPEAGQPFSADRLRWHRDVYARERNRARRSYVESLPRLAVSRCPFTGELVEHSFDADGIEGLWWRSELPERPAEALPATFVALTGALRFERAPPATSFLVQSGPAAPYLLPSVLQSPGEVTAVICSLSVGDARGYAVCYFSRARADVTARIPAWGAGNHRWEPGSPLLLPDGDRALERDFELAPWVDRGALRWIAPGDGAHELRATVLDCPYLDLPGSHEEHWSLDGRVFDPAAEDDRATGTEG